MKSNKISESGMITADGRLRLPMDRLKECFAEHKGERVVVRIYFDVLGSTAAQQSYYYQYIVPTIQQAFKEIGERKSENAVDEFLINRYPGDKSESEFGLGADVREARHLNRAQMFEYLEWLKQYAAENLFVYIDDPRTI